MKAAPTCRGGLASSAGMPGSMVPMTSCFGRGLGFEGFKELRIGTAAVAVGNHGTISRSISITVSSPDYLILVVLSMLAS